MKNNVFFKSIHGFTFGITMLLVSYISIYFILGENAFIMEIRQLENINLLLNQIIVFGFMWYLLAISFNMIILYQNNELKNKKISYNYKDILFMLIVNFLLGAMFVIYKNIFSTNIGIMNILIMLLGLSIVGIYCLIKYIKDSFLIKQINKKLQEKKL